LQFDGQLGLEEKSLGSGGETIMSGKNIKKGIVYLALGYEYLLMAAHSARTARKSNPGLQLELITNIRFQEIEMGDGFAFDTVRMVDCASDENRFIKTNIVRYTDLDYGVYIDCDTEVWGDLEPVFQCLDQWDVAMKLSVKPTTKKYEVAPGLPSALFSEWNGGVVFFRNNERSARLFDAWTEIFRREGKNRDQPALACAVYQSGWGGQLLSLNPIWNTARWDVRLLQNGLRDSRVWHYRKAKDYPAVAPAILQLHAEFHREIARQNSSLQPEIRELERRYRFLSSRIYRLSCVNRRLNEALVRGVNILMGLKIISGFTLERDERVGGDGYPEIESSIPQT
jgi:hypothetical protein